MCCLVLRVGLWRKAFKTPSLACCNAATKGAHFPVTALTEPGRASDVNRESGSFLLAHGWLMKGRMGVWKPPLPGPLLHKCVEEREKTPEVSLHEPAVLLATRRHPLLATARGTG